MENNNVFSEKQKSIALCKWLLKKYKPAMIAYWILMLLAFPFVELCAILLNAKTNSGFDFSAYLDYAEVDLILIQVSVTPLIAFIFSSILAILCFRFLHNKRLTDLFGGLPISKKSMFLACYFSAAVMSIVPVIGSGIVGAIISFKIRFALAILLSTLKFSLVTLGNVSLIAFISICCGLTLDTIISHLILCIVYPLFIFITLYFPSTIIPGMDMHQLPYNLYTLLCPLGAYYTGSEASDLFLDHTVIFIIWWSALSVILTVLSTLLYKKRKAEVAQAGFAFSIVEKIIKFFACFTGGLFVGYLITFFFAVIHSFGIRGQYIFLGIDFILGALLVHFLIHLIFHKGLEGFKASLKECAIVVVVGFAYIIIAGSGLFGYVSQVPKADDVKNISISEKYHKFTVNGKNIAEMKYSDKESIEALISFHQEIVNDANSYSGYNHYGLYNILNPANGFYYESTFIDNWSFPIEIKYKLKNGRTIKRTYYYTYDDDIDTEQLSGVLAKREKQVLYSIPKDNLESIGINKGRDGGSDDIDFYFSYNKNAKDKLYDALLKDYTENGPYDYKKNTCVYTIELYYSNSTKYGEDNYFSYKIYIPDSFTNTLSLIGKARRSL
ncbi:MAG: hypothetical protein E7254_01125 [Lachnospiraceae bacterium]|nr:hypothetical protein [Lachnospiraceae bacterium]